MAQESMNETSLSLNTIDTFSLGSWKRFGRTLSRKPGKHFIGRPSAGPPRYRVIELVGQGGMGSVYRAEHRLMNRTVAIKLVNSQLVRHPQAVERFSATDRLFD
jgi:serine/threonine protein kinase